MDNNTPQAPVDVATPDGITPSAPSQPETPKEDKQEKKFTKRERLEFTLEKIQSQLAELDDEQDDTRPVTVGDLKRMKQEEGKNTAIELANQIEDEVERLAVVDMLEERLVPSGDPKADLELARSAVNAKKNQMLTEEMARRGTPSSHGSAPGAPGRPQDVFTPTATEEIFMQPPYNLSVEDIKKLRHAQ